MPQVFPESRWRWTPLAAAGGSLLLAVLLFFLIPLTQHFGQVEEPKVTFRRVILSAPPPSTPPPPPDNPPPQPDQPKPEMAEEPPSINIQPLDIDFSVGAGEALAMGVSTPHFQNEMDTVAEIKEVFTFEDLLETPRLLNIPSYRFPRNLRRQGIESGDVVVKIRILPNGKAELLRIVSSSHRELEAIIPHIVGQIRFTPPIIDGQPQPVVGTYPLLLQDQ